MTAEAHQESLTSEDGVLTVPVTDGRLDWSAVCAYQLPFVPQGWQWSLSPDGTSLPIDGDKRALKYSGTFLPCIGAEVHVKHGGFRWGVVTAYFVELGYLGVEIRPLRPPKWWLNQAESREPEVRDIVHCFGVEIDAIRKSA